MISGTEHNWWEWALSGAGIVMLSGAGRWLYRKFLRPNPLEPPKPETHPIQITSSSTSANARNTSPATEYGAHANSAPVGTGASVSASVVTESNNSQQMTGEITARPEFIPLKRKSASPSFEEIRELENAVPTFQRGDFRKNCCGVKVGWLLSVLSVGKNGFKGDDYVRLSLSTKSHGLVYCSVKITDYPIVKMIHPGRSVWVEGEISEIDGIAITLTNAILQFGQMPGDASNLT
jgi:hypothetical protein